MERTVSPQGTVSIVPDGPGFAARELERGFAASRPMGRDDSLCHAWSGPPAYFIRKYFQD